MSETLLTDIFFLSTEPGKGLLLVNPPITPAERDVIAEEYGDVTFVADSRSQNESFAAVRIDADSEATAISCSAGILQILTSDFGRRVCVNSNDFTATQPRPTFPDLTI